MAMKEVQAFKQFRIDPICFSQFLHSPRVLFLSLCPVSFQITDNITIDPGHNGIGGNNELEHLIFSKDFNSEFRTI